MKRDGATDKLRKAGTIGVRNISMTRRNITQNINETVFIQSENHSEVAFGGGENLYSRTNLNESHVMNTTSLQIFNTTSSKPSINSFFNNITTSNNSLLNTTIQPRSIFNTPSNNSSLSASRVSNKTLSKRGKEVYETNISNKSSDEKEEKKVVDRTKVALTITIWSAAGVSSSTLNLGEFTTDGVSRWMESKKEDRQPWLLELLAVITMKMILLITTPVEKIMLPTPTRTVKATRPIVTSA